MLESRKRSGTIITFSITLSLSLVYHPTPYLIVNTTPFLSSPLPSRPLRSPREKRPKDKRSSSHKSVKVPIGAFKHLKNPPDSSIPQAESKKSSKVQKTPSKRPAEKREGEKVSSEISSRNADQNPHRARPAIADGRADSIPCPGEKVVIWVRSISMFVSFFCLASNNSVPFPQVFRRQRSFKSLEKAIIIIILRERRGILQEEEEGKDIIISKLCGCPTGKDNP